MTDFGMTAEFHEPDREHTQAHRRQPDTDWGALCDTQTRRLQAIDPDLGAILPPDDEPLDALRAGDPEDEIWGIPRHATFTTDDPISLWGPATREILQVRSAATPNPQAFSELLSRWLTRISAEGATGTDDRGAIIRLPTAETSLARPLLDAGFAPQTTTAILPVRPSMAEAPSVSDLDLRPPTRSDRETLLDLAEEMLASDIAARSAWPRPDNRALLAHYVDEMLHHDDGWAYVAEDESGVVGLISLNPPEHSDWAAASTSLRPVVYLALAAVTPQARRQGVGRRLVTAAHRQAATSGQRVIVLDHASLSPLSAPFWHRHGYRPLCTTWLKLL